MSMRSYGLFLAIAALSLAPPAIAHEHGEDHIPEGETISVDPIVRTLDVPLMLYFDEMGTDTDSIFRTRRYGCTFSS